MHSARTSSIVALLLVVFHVGAAQAGSFTPVWGQTLCIDGVGNGTSWAYELRPLGGGTPFCSGVGSVTGTPADIVAVTVSAIDGCGTGVSAAPVAALGLCPSGMAAVTIWRGPDSVNWELAIEDDTVPPTVPPTLKVPTPTDPVFFNPGCRPAVQTPIPIPVPEPGSLVLLASGGFGLVGLSRLRRR